MARAGPSNRQANRSSNNTAHPGHGIRGSDDITALRQVDLGFLRFSHPTDSELPALCETIESAASSPTEKIQSTWPLEVCLQASYRTEITRTEKETDAANLFHGPAHAGEDSPLSPRHAGSGVSGTRTFPFP